MSLNPSSIAAELPVKKTLNLAALKTMVAAAEAEAARRGVEVSVCIVDESGHVLFFQKADGTGLNTIQFAQKKARHAAIYRQPSKVAADRVKGGDVALLEFSRFLPESRRAPHQGWRPDHWRDWRQRRPFGSRRSDQPSGHRCATEIASPEAGVSVCASPWCPPQRERSPSRHRRSRQLYAACGTGRTRHCLCSSIAHSHPQTGSSMR